MAAKKKAARKRRRARQRPKPPAPGEKRPAHRPSAYTAELGQAICQVYATDARTLERLCEEHESFPRSTFTLYDWLEGDEEFKRSFTRAKKAHAAIQIDQGLRVLVEVDPDRAGGIGSARVARAKAEADYRARIAASMDPETWSERRRMEHSGEVRVPVKPDLSQLSDDELRQAADLARKVRGSA